MKKFKKALTLIVAFLIVFSTGLFTACNNESGSGNESSSFDDGFGGGGTVDTPNDVENTETEDEIESAGKVDISDLKADGTVPEDATVLTGEVIEIEKSGNYYVTGEHTSIEIIKKDLEVNLYLQNATLTNLDGKALSSKKTQLCLTLIGDNKISNEGDDVNAVHIKGNMVINGNGSLTVNGGSKSGIKVSKTLTIVDATLNVSAQNHGVTAETIVANSAKINVTKAGKDGLHAECDYEYDKKEGIDLDACVYTKEAGFVSLIDVDYSCNVSGDGIQADTFVYINGGNYDITTNGVFVAKTSANMAEYGLTSDDFRYIYSNRTYQKVDSDYRGSSSRYALTQSCKGIKVGEIEFDSTGDGEDDVVITDGDYIIMIQDGTFTINSTDDALHTNSGDVVINGGTFTVNTTDDGMHADELLKINGGNIDIYKSYEGLEGGYVEINDGNIYVVATDDGINAASDDRKITEHIIIAGGIVTISAEGDGIDSNGTLLISGGVVTVFGPTNGGDAGLDADNGILVTGGTLFVTSALGMIETPGKNSTQYVVSYASSNSYLSAGEVITVKDSDGNELLSVTLEKRCQSLIFSLGEFESNKTYTLNSSNEVLATFTLTNVITTIGNAQGQGGFGGRPGGGPRW